MAGSFVSGTGLGEMEGKGMDTLNVLPFPGALSMSILPNRSSTSLRVMDSPSPNPSCPCFLSLCTAQAGELFEYAFLLTGCHAASGIGYAEHELITVVFCL